MCRNIKTLAHFDPPATPEEVYAASLQFVKKVSGCSAPSNVNEAVFNSTVEKVAKDITKLIQSLTFSGPYRNREVEMKKAQERNTKRFRKNL